MLETTLKPDDTVERCGFVLTDGEIVELDNVAPQPEHSYEINPEQALPYVKAGAITATWHTHPGESATLSGEDWDGFLLWPDLDHYIVGIDGVKRYKVENKVVIECD